MATHSDSLLISLPHKHKDCSVTHPIVCPTVHSLFVRSSDRLIVRSIVHDSFVPSSDRPSILRPNNYWSAVIIPKFRSFDRSFIIPIHRSFVRSYELFTVHQIVHNHYSSYSSFVRSLEYSTTHPS
jgi:hypothetical protein